MPEREQTPRDRHRTQGYKTRNVPIEQPFEAGHGRPDLDMLHQVVSQIDNGMWDLDEVRYAVASYINQRPDDRNL